jgi:hypothetical protein
MDGLYELKHRNIPAIAVYTVHRLCPINHRRGLNVNYVPGDYERVKAMKTPGKGGLWSVKKICIIMGEIKYVDSFHRWLFHIYGQIPGVIFYAVVKAFDRPVVMRSVCDRRS